MVRFNDLSTKQKASKEDRFDVLAAEIDAAATGDSSKEHQTGGDCRHSERPHP